MRLFSPESSSQSLSSVARASSEDQSAMKQRDAAACLAALALSEKALENKGSSVHLGQVSRKENQAARGEASLVFMMRDSREDRRQSLCVTLYGVEDELAH